MRISGVLVVRVIGVTVDADLEELAAIFVAARKRDGFFDQFESVNDGEASIVERPIRLVLEGILSLLCRVHCLFESLQELDVEFGNLLRVQRCLPRLRSIDDEVKLGELDLGAGGFPAIEKGDKKLGIHLL